MMQVIACHHKKLTEKKNNPRNSNCRWGSNFFEDIFVFFYILFCPY